MGFDRRGPRFRLHPCSSSVFGRRPSWYSPVREHLIRHTYERAQVQRASTSTIRVCVAAARSSRKNKEEIKLTTDAIDIADLENEGGASFCTTVLAGIPSPAPRPEYAYREVCNTVIRCYQADSPSAMIIEPAATVRK